MRIHQMADALTRRGHEVHVITYHLADSRVTPGYQVHRIPNVRTYRKCSPGPTLQKLLVLDPMLAATLARVLRQGSFDVIHAHHYEGLLAALMARAMRPIPIVFDAHTLLESELPFYGMSMLQRVKRTLGRALDRHLPPRASHVVAVTDELRDKLLVNGLPAGDVTVITNGVECEHFDVPVPSRSDAHPPKLIFTGNLAAYQGIELMLHAFAEVRRQRDGVRLHIMSDSSFEPYEAMAQTLGIREAIDLERADFNVLPQRLAEADVALNPRTQCEGIPQKLLNYMAAGKPIVSFEGSARGLIHRRRGWVVPDGDIQGFAAGILTLLTDQALAQRIGSNARRYVFSELSWDSVARRAETVYDRLLPEEAPPLHAHHQQPAT